MNRNLAEAAPRVEAALAESAQYTDAATAAMVQQSEAPKTSPAQKVEPATTDGPQTTATNTISSSVSTSSLTVAKLRGGSGADMECYAAILRGAPEKNVLQKFLPFIFDERDFITYGEVKKYMVVKAGSCFVYGEESDPSPMYSIPLNEVFAVLEDRNKPEKGSITISPIPNSNLPREGLVTVLLKYRKNKKQAYQFTFDTKATDKSFPKRFMELVEQAQMKGGPVTASVIKADRMGKEVMKNQPTI